MKNFTGRVAVITGAVSGLGKEIARTGALLGMKLVIADIEKEALDKVAAELSKGGAEVLAVHCDVSKPDHVEQMASQCMDRFHTVHMLFNNAGVGCGGLVWENTQADWEWVLGVNLWGVIHGVRVFMPIMIECSKQEQGYKGHIINTASMAGLVNAPALGVYNVSKHAVISLTETLYQDLKLVDIPISASVLCPYFTPTGISNAERNCPNELSNYDGAVPSAAAAQALLDMAVQSGRVTASEVADITFQAIRDDVFYIFPHPSVVESAKKRVETIISERHPGDPYESAPYLRDMLRTNLKQP